MKTGVPRGRAGGSGGGKAAGEDLSWGAGGSGGLGGGCGGEGNGGGGIGGGGGGIGGGGGLGGGGGCHT